eukprot:1317928-Amorphochlora_amoeboformis.AAC.1
MDDLDDPVKPLNERQKLSKEVFFHPRCPRDRRLGRKYAIIKLNLPFPDCLSLMFSHHLFDSVVKEMLERSGKKIKTLKEHKEEVKKKKESQISDAVNRREAEERRDRAQAERVVKKWEKNYTSEESDIKEEGLNVILTNAM